MKTFRSIILESLKSPYPYKIEKGSGVYRAYWEVPGDNKRQYAMGYHFEALRQGLEYYEFEVGEDSWNIEFIAHDHDSGTDIIGSGQAFRVFATVSTILKEFIKSKNPSMFHFTAQEPSRIKLYDRFAKQIKKIAGYKFIKLMGDNDVLYICSKKKLVLDNIPTYYSIVKRG
jgi:hypothetical protein